MNQKDNPVMDGSAESPCEIVKEKLIGSEAILTNFYFTYGANLYAISYRKEGRTRHTLIDTGDRRYREQVERLLSENDIAIEDIENIIITHSHPDHCGLADNLAEKSGANILVHHDFKKAIERVRGEDERGWWGGFELSELTRHSLIYLSPGKDNSALKINGMEFLRLGPSLDIGGARLNILACPAAESTHTSDQMIIHYSPRDNLVSDNESASAFRINDDMLFSGDLWLMVGPNFGGNFRRRRHHGDKFQRRKFIREHREQDYAAKDSLKRGFSLIRVKPGHGREFIGSRIIALSLLADRDLLPELGYSRNANKSLIKREGLAEKVTALQERAFHRFTEELALLAEAGYSPEETAGFLVRIYREQSGGNKSVEKDREERKVRLVENLTRLEHDEEQPAKLNQMAGYALSGLDKAV